MLRQKKFRQQAIYLQQSLSIQQHLVLVDAQESPILQPLHGLGESIAQFDAKLFAEVTSADMAKLELQNKLANQSLLVGWRQRSPYWQFALLNTLHIRLEVVLIL